MFVSCFLWIDPSAYINDRFDQPIVFLLFAESVGVINNRIFGSRDENITRAYIVIIPFINYCKTNEIRF